MVFTAHAPQFRVASSTRNVCGKCRQGAGCPSAPSERAARYIPIAIGVPNVSHGGVVLIVKPPQVLLCLLLVQLQLDGDIAHFGHQ
jgi:hypothetical protein